METHAFGFRSRANTPKGQKRFPISFSSVQFSYVTSERAATLIRLG